MALGIVKVSGNGNDRFRYGFAQVIFGGFFHFAQNVGADLLRRHFVATHFNPGIAIVGSDDGIRHEADVFLDFFFGELATDQTLDGVERIAWVGHRLALGRGAD